MTHLTIETAPEAPVGRTQAVTEAAIEFADALGDAIATALFLAALLTWCVIIERVT